MHQLVDPGNAQHEDCVEQHPVVEQGEDCEVDVDRLVPHLMVGVQDQQGDRVPQNPQHTDRRQNNTCDYVFDHVFLSPFCSK